MPRCAGQKHVRWPAAGLWFPVSRVLLLLQQQLLLLLLLMMMMMMMMIIVMIVIVMHVRNLHVNLVIVQLFSSGHNIQ